MMSIAPPNISINAKAFMDIQICVVAGTYATWIGVIVDIVVTGIVPSQLIVSTSRLILILTRLLASMSPWSYFFRLACT